MTELFPESSVTKLSPRLEWLRRHNLALGELPDGTRFCLGRDGVGYGDTHKDAELEYCAATDTVHYEIEEFEKAGVIMPEKTQNEDWG